MHEQKQTNRRLVEPQVGEEVYVPLWVYQQMLLQAVRFAQMCHAFGREVVKVSKKRSATTNRLICAQFCLLSLTRSGKKKTDRTEKKTLDWELCPIR